MPSPQLYTLGEMTGEQLYERVHLGWRRSLPWEEIDVQAQGYYNLLAREENEQRTSSPLPGR